MLTELMLAIAILALLFVVMPLAELAVLIAGVTGVALDSRQVRPSNVRWVIR